MNRRRQGFDTGCHACGVGAAHGPSHYRKAASGPIRRQKWEAVALREGVNERRQLDAERSQQAALVVIVFFAIDGLNVGRGKRGRSWVAPAVHRDDAGQRPGQDPSAFPKCLWRMGGDGETEGQKDKTCWRYIRQSNARP